MIDLQDYINENYIVQGLKDYSYDEIVELVSDYIEEKLNESDINIEIKEIWLHGSRLRNTAKKSSDLDAVLFYSGSYNVVYTAFTGDGKTVNDVDLMDYHANRNSFRWTPFRRKKTDGGFEFIACPYISEQSYPTWSHDWLNDKEYEDKNIYSFIQDKTFTLIIYDSRDYDSVLTKDIVVKQYQTGYHRDTEDWKKDGVVIYDVADDRTDYPTYESTCFFDLTCYQ